MTGGITGQGQATYANTISNINANNGIPSGGVFTPRTYGSNSSGTTAGTPSGSGGTSSTSPSLGTAVSSNGGSTLSAPSGSTFETVNGVTSIVPLPTASVKSTSATSSSSSGSSSAITSGIFSVAQAEAAGFGVFTLSTQPGGYYLKEGENYYNIYGNLIGNQTTGIIGSTSNNPAGLPSNLASALYASESHPMPSSPNLPNSGITQASLTPPIDFATFGNNAQIQWSTTNPFNFTLEESIPGYPEAFKFTGTIGGQGISAGTIYAQDSAVNQAWSALTGGAPLWGSQGVITSYASQKGLQSLPITFNLQNGEISSSGAILGEIGTYGSTPTPLYGNVEQAQLSFNLGSGNPLVSSSAGQTFVTFTPTLTPYQQQVMLSNAALASNYNPGNYIYSGPSGYNQVQVTNLEGLTQLEGIANAGNTFVGYTSSPFIPGNYVASTNPSATPQYVSLEAFATAAPGTTFSQTTTSTVSTQSTSSGTLPYSLTALGVLGAISGGTYNALTSWMSSSPSNTVSAEPTGINFQGTTQIPLSSGTTASINKEYGLWGNIDTLAQYANPTPINSVSAINVGTKSSYPLSSSASSYINQQYTYIAPWSAPLIAGEVGSAVSPKSTQTPVPSPSPMAIAEDVLINGNMLDFLEYPQAQAIKYANSQVTNPNSTYSIVQGAINQANSAPTVTSTQWLLKQTGIRAASQQLLLQLALWSPGAGSVAQSVPVLGGQTSSIILPGAAVINSPTASLETKSFAFAGMLGTGLYDAVTAYYVTLGIGGIIDLATGSAVAGAGVSVGGATRAAISAASGSPEASATNLAAYAKEIAAANAAYGQLSLAAKVGQGAISISNFVNSYALAGYGISYGQVATGTYVPTYTTNLGQDIFIRETIGGLENALFATTVSVGFAGGSAAWEALHPGPVSAANGGVLQGGDVNGPKVTIFENYPKPVSVELPGGGIMFQSDPGIQIAHISENPLQPMIDQGDVVMGVKEGSDNAFTAVMRDSEGKMGLYGNQVLMSEPPVNVGSDLPVYLRNKPAAINFAAKVANIKAAEQASNLLGQSSVSLSGVKAVQLPLYGEYEVEVPLAQVSVTYAEQPAVKGNWLSQQLENLRVSVLGRETTYLSTTQGNVNMFASAKGDMQIGLATQGLDSEWNTYVSTTNPLRRLFGLDAQTYTPPPMASPSVKGLFETIATKDPDSLSFFANTPGGVTSIMGHVEGTGVPYENGMVEYTGEGITLGRMSNGAPINLKISILASNAQNQDLAQMLDAYYSPKSPFAVVSPSGSSVDLGLEQIGNGGAFTPLSRENPLVTSLGVEPIYGSATLENAQGTAFIASEAAPAMNSAGRYLGTSGGKGLNDVSTAEYNGPAGTSVQISNPLRTMFEVPAPQVQSAAAGAIASQAAQVATQSQLEASLFANPPIPALIDPAAMASPEAIANINTTRGFSIASFKTSKLPLHTSTVTSTTTAPTLSTATLGTLLNQENQQLIELQTIASLGFQQFEQQTLGYTNQFVGSLGYAGAYSQYQALTAPLQKEVSSIETTISSLLGTTSTLSLNPSSVSQSYLQGVEYQIAADIQNIFNLEAGLGLTVLARESPMAAELGSSISGITTSGIMNELEPGQKLRKQSAAPLSNLQGNRESFLPGAARTIKELNKVRSNQRANRIENMRERERLGEQGRERIRDEFNYREWFRNGLNERYGEAYAPKFAFKPVSEQITSQISKTTTSERNSTATALTPVPPAASPPPPPPLIPLLPQSPNNYEPQAVKGNGILNYTPASEYHPSATTQLLPELEPEFEREFVPALSGVLVRPLKEPASLKAKIKNVSGKAHML